MGGLAISQQPDPDEPIGYDADDEPIYAIRTPLAKTAAGQGSHTPLGWKPSLEKPIPVVQCTKIKKDGNRCGRWSVRGLDRCVKHAGWNLPSVREKAQARVDAARLRLVDAAPEAAEWLIDLGTNSSSDAVRLGAAKEVLDRAGVRGGVEVDITVENKQDPAALLRTKISQVRERVITGEVVSSTTTALEPGDTVLDTAGATPAPDTEHEESP
jgi:hypothetical protein